MSPKMRCQRERDVYPQYAASSFKIYTQQQSNSWLTSGSISEAWLYIVKMFVLFFLGLHFPVAFSKKHIPPTHSSTPYSYNIADIPKDLPFCRRRVALSLHQCHKPLTTALLPNEKLDFSASARTLHYKYMYTYNQGAMTLICRRRSNCFFFFLPSNTITYTSTRMLRLHVCRFFGMIPTEMSYTVWHERHRT